MLPDILAIFAAILLTGLNYAAYLKNDKFVWSLHVPSVIFIILVILYNLGTLL